MKGISNALQIKFNIIKNGDDILYACQMIACVKNDVDPSFDQGIAGVSRPFPVESEPGNGVYHYVRQEKHDVTFEMSSGNDGRTMNDLRGQRRTKIKKFRGK